MKYLLLLVALLCPAQTLVRPQQIKNWAQVNFQVFDWTAFVSKSDCTGYWQNSPVPSTGGFPTFVCSAVIPATLNGTMVGRGQMVQGLTFHFHFGLANVCELPTTTVATVQLSYVLICVYDNLDRAVMQTVLSDFPPCPAPGYVGPCKQSAAMIP